MKLITGIILASFMLASPSIGYMTHDQIVKKLSSQEGEAQHKKGKVLYLPRDKVLKHKKKKKAKHEQKFGRKHSPDPIPQPSAAPSATASPTPSVSPSPSPVASNTPGTIILGQGADLRGCDTKIKSQNTPWCTAFSLTALIENLACDHTDLSIHHVWSLYEEYSVESAAKAVPGTKITIWDKWTENARKPSSDYLSFTKHKLTKIVEIDGETTEDDINEVKTSLDHHFPVYVGLSVPSDMASCFSTIRPGTSVTSGGHAVAVVGYKLDDRILGGGYLIIKNSWGDDCGDKGYQYMPFSVCAKSSMYCYFYSVQKID